MSSDRETTRIVRSWLEEGVTALPDRVLDTVLDQVPATPQRRSWWPAWRSSTMNAFRVAIAAAAVLVAAVVGFNLLPPVGPGGQPSPAPSPSPSATPRPFPVSGSIEPGRYFWVFNGGRVTVDMPAGWLASGSSVLKAPDQPGEIGWGVATREITHVYSDACRSEGALESIGPSAADLVQALEAQLGSQAVVTDLDLGGLAAKRIELAPDAGLDRAQCRHGADGPLQVWADPAETDFYALAPGFTGSVVVADVNGTRVVLLGTQGPATRAPDIAEREAIIASMTIAS